MPRMIALLLSMKDDTVSIHMSYYEIYNEIIKDLIVPMDGLDIREDPNKGVIIADLSEHDISNMS